MGFNKLNYGEIAKSHVSMYYKQKNCYYTIPILGSVERDVALAPL